MVQIRRLKILLRNNLEVNKMKNRNLKETQKWQKQAELSILRLKIGFSTWQ
jgi:hypothetical protein